MNLLSELNQISNLSDAQKTVLAITNFSATPTQAFAATTGSDKLVYARDSLVKMGYISLNNGQLSVSPSGQNALVQYNLIDQTGQATDNAVNLLQAARNDSVDTQEQTIPQQ